MRAMQPPQPALSDVQAMALALEQARAAAAAGEVPVGAVLVRQGRVLAQAHNACIGLCDPSAHAEILALRRAAAALGNYRLQDCTLYVTLEPCPMCAGAMLHARLARVVYGACDPRTGAAGSWLNLFSQPGLNHKVEVTGGVLAAQCAELLHGFFRPRRHKPQVLRPDALRTPEAAFASLPDPQLPRRTLSGDWPVLDGLQMSLVDAGSTDAPLSWLCLHGQGSWSHGLRHLFGPWLQAGHRVLAPDLIGFGRSDKPKKTVWHRFDWHRQCLLELIEQLDMQRAVLVLQGSALPLGLSLLLAAPRRFVGVFSLAGHWPQPGQAVPHGRTQLRGLAPVERAVLQAPFPDRGHAAALRAQDLWSPEQAQAEPLMRSLHNFWQQVGAPACVHVQAPERTALTANLALSAHALNWQGLASPLALTDAIGAELAQRSLQVFSAV